MEEKGIVHISKRIPFLDCIWKRRMKDCTFAQLSPENPLKMNIHMYVITEKESHLYSYVQMNYSTIYV